jgi:hypothetical protein
VHICYVVMLVNLGLVQRTSSLTIREKFGTIVLPLLAVLDYVIAILTGCFSAKSRKSPLGYEDTALLASETICKLLENLFLFLLIFTEFPDPFLISTFRILFSSWLPGHPLLPSQFKH